MFEIISRCLDSRSAVVKKYTDSLVKPLSVPSWHGGNGGSEAAGLPCSQETAAPSGLLHSAVLLLLLCDSRFQATATNHGQLGSNSTDVIAQMRTTVSGIKVFAALGYSLIEKEVHGVSVSGGKATARAPKRTPRSLWWTLSRHLSRLSCCSGQWFIQLEG